MPDHHCEPLVVEDGQVIATVHGQHPMSAEATDALNALVLAAVAHHEARPDRAEIDARQEASRARIRARNARLLGEADA